MQKICLLLVALATSAFAAEIEKEDGVIILTDENFESVLEANEFLLVEFYAPWCGHCKKLTPEYAGAAEVLNKNDPPLTLAKLDATEHKATAERFGVQGFPTLYFFKKGEKQEYTGGRTKDTIISWMLKKSGPVSAVVTCEGLKEKVKDNKFVLAYFGEETEPLFKDAHLPLADSNDKITFVHLNDAACAAEHSVSGSGSVLFKTFEDPFLIYPGKADKDALLEWTKPLMVPTVFEFTEEEIDSVFGQQQPTLVLFRNTEKDGKAEFMQVFEQAAHTHKGKMLFAYADAVGGIQERLAEFMGVTAADLPTLRAVLPADMKKFECDTAVAALTIEVIGKFADDILSGALKPHLKSDPIPEDNAGPVTTVVGLNFAETVLDSTKDVLVKYYAPWCGHCKKLAPIWEELGELYKDNKDIVIAKFDSTTNEAEGVEVKGYPTLIFYPKGNKAGVTFEGDRTLEGLTKYLEEQIPSLVSASGAGGAAAEGEL